jgi:hypothetical protein
MTPVAASMATLNASKATPTGTDSLNAVHERVSSARASGGSSQSNFVPLFKVGFQLVDLGIAPADFAPEGANFDIAQLNEFLQAGDFVHDFLDVVIHSHLWLSPS